MKVCPGMALLPAVMLATTIHFKNCCVDGVCVSSCGGGTVTKAFSRLKKCFLSAGLHSGYIAIGQ